ncbi:HD-GYP domain-containing protein [Synechococcus sp. GreenBA-s]|nr:HD-GYP domain-containing protein [Synechococcus sp. GreenBA-s]
METEALGPSHAERPKVGGMANSLHVQLKELHARILAMAPTIDHIACVPYGQATDLLRTVVSSTRSGKAATSDKVKRPEVGDLHALTRHLGMFGLSDIAVTVEGPSEHSSWLQQHGYLSSLTVPMSDNGVFIGLIFYGSLQANAFTASLQRDLELFSNLINITISSLYAAVRSLRASAVVAQDCLRLRDYETGNHLDRVAHYSRLIAKSLASPLGLSNAFVEQLFHYTPLHDIGKLGIPDAILRKTGELSSDERQLIQTHVELGLGILETVIGIHAVEDLPDFTLMRNIVGGHHERLDGSGYPKGLRGEAIPLEARIVAVADVFDAITCRRPYREPLPIEEGLLELERQVAAGHLDPRGVAALRRHSAEVVAIRQRFQDT